jgi:hypothetical protein
MKASGQRGGVGGPGEIGSGADVAASWAAVRGGVGGSGGVGEEDLVLGAGKAGAFFASTAACGGEAGSSGGGQRRHGTRSRGWGGVVRGTDSRGWWLLWGNRQGEGR